MKYIIFCKSSANRSHQCYCKELYLFIFYKQKIMSCINQNSNAWGNDLHGFCAVSLVIRCGRDGLTELSVCVLSRDDDNFLLSVKCTSHRAVCSAVCEICEMSWIDLLSDDVDSRLVASDEVKSDEAGGTLTAGSSLVTVPTSPAPASEFCIHCLMLQSTPSHAPFETLSPTTVTGGGDEASTSWHEVQLDTIPVSVESFEDCDGSATGTVSCSAHPRPFAWDDNCQILQLWQCIKALF